MLTLRNTQKAFYMQRLNGRKDCYSVTEVQTLFDGKYAFLAE